MIRYSSLEEELEEELEDSLEDLTDGLDVLMILERAYEKTMKAHVKPSESSPTHSPLSAACDGQNANSEASHSHSATPSQTAVPQTPTTTQSSQSFDPQPYSSRSALSQPSSAPTSSPTSASSPEPTPLREGSATALVAILDHAPAPTPLTNRANRTQQSTPTASRLPSSSSSFFFPRPRVFPPPVNFTAHEEKKVNCDNGAEHVRAVIRIAHLGDCMGMLIRGDEIVWRTEEMWWNVSCSFLISPSLCISMMNDELMFCFYIH